MTTVLIVDDHPSLRLVLRQHLSQILGVTGILEAGNGQDAVQAVREHAPGLIVLDIDLPRMNGLEAIPRMKALQPHVRILVISGQDPIVYAPRVKAAGGQGYISKAQEMSEIVRAVEAVMAGYTIFPDIDRSQRVAGRPAGAYALDGLSNKELTVMQMLVRGMSNKEIADALYISNKTVSTYKTRLMNKLGVRSLVELVDFARKQDAAR